MPRFSRIPEMVKVNGKWVLSDFYPTQPAFMWEDHAGKTGTIYAVGSGEFVKLGISKNFASRYKQIDMGTPLPIKSLATRTVPLAGLAYAEAWLHERFKASRVKGEWFQITPKEAIASLAPAVRRAHLYERYCFDWHRRETLDRATPERKAKLAKEFQRSLEALALDELMAEDD